MTVSSAEVIDSVAAEIRRYMEVQRREEGFDLSGPCEPRKAYPLLKTGSITSVGKLQDRSLKHYFTPSMIRTHIANLEAVPPGSPREKAVKKRLTRRMKEFSHRNSSHHELAIAHHLNEELYSAQMEALQMLHSETQKKLRRKVVRGPPVLRRSVPAKMTHGEAMRLVNRSSQILVATETVALAHDIISRRHGLGLRPHSAPASWSNGLPGLYRSPDRPKTARGRVSNHQMITSTPKSSKKPRYVWDINGRRQRVYDVEETYEDDQYSSCSLSTSSADFEPEERLPWRRYRPTRPMSAMALPHKLHVNRSARPHSARYAHHQENDQPQVASASRVSPDSGFCIDAETQTKHRRKQGVKQVVASSSERGSEVDVTVSKYKVEIKTGDRLGAGTVADIYLSMHGDQGETDEIYLTNPITADKKHKPFKRAQVDVFEIETEHIGNLQRIGIGHDQKQKGFSWYLDYVKIWCNDKSWLFHCKMWLSGACAKRKTFRHIAVDHQSSESSESADTSSSSSGNSKPRKFYRRKSNSSSAKSNKSSRSNGSRFNSSSEKAEKKDVPVLSVQPATPTSSGHTFGARSESHSSSESSKSSLEYSSDSTVTEKKTESFLEESEDARQVTSSEAMSDAGEGEASKFTPFSGETKSGKDPKLFPFSVDNLFTTPKIDLSSSSSSSESHASFYVNEKLGSRKSSSSESVTIRKSSSSESVTVRKSSSSSDNVPVWKSSSSSGEVEQAPKLEKRYSLTLPLSINLESVKPVSAPLHVSADVTTGSPLITEQSETTEHVVLDDLKEKVESSSSSDSENSAASTSEGSTVKEAAKPASSPRLFLAKPDSLAEESSPKPPDPEFVEEDVFQVSEDATPEEEAEVTEQNPSHMASSSSSRKSSSSSSEQASIKEQISDKDVESGHVIEEEKENDVAQEAVEEKADAIMDGFNAGLLASRKLSITSPYFLDGETGEGREIDEGLQSDEEGIVQSAVQPSIRGDIHDLIKEGENEKVIEVATLRPELLEKTNEKGWSPIHMAATHGKLEILQWLTGQGANLKADTPTGYTALHMAAMHGHVKCVSVLHAMGADIDARNVDEQTPLHLACMSGHLETAKWLVANRADVHARDLFQRSAFDLSKQYHHHDVSQFLKACLHDLKQDGSSMSLLQSSKSSIGSSRSRSSSSSSASSEEEEREEKPSKWHDDPENADRDTVTEMASLQELEEKKKMYEEQKKKMVRRRSSFLDVIRSEAGVDPKSSNSSSSSDSESSSK